MPYVATISGAGYLPDTEPAECDTPREAWEHLADQRRDHEDAEHTGVDGYSATKNILESLGTGYNLGSDSDYQNAGLDPFECTGTIFGPTPGYTGDHDIPIAYTVTFVEVTA